MEGYLRYIFQSYKKRINLSSQITVCFSLVNIVCNVWLYPKKMCNMCKCDELWIFDMQHFFLREFDMQHVLIFNFIYIIYHIICNMFWFFKLVCWSHCEKSDFHRMANRLVVLGREIPILDDLVYIYSSLWFNCLYLRC